MITSTHGHADEVLRKYLLGRLAPEALEAIEARLFSDDRIFWERLCLVEEELVDDYAWGRLEGEDREGFEQVFLGSDERRAKLEFARALRTCVIEQDAVPSPFWRWLRDPVAAPGWAVAAAAVLLLAVGPGVTWKYAVRRAPQGIVSAWLVPGQVRDIGQAFARVEIGPGCQLVRLPLETDSGTYDSYSATLVDVTDDEVEVWSQHRLAAGAIDGKLAVTLTLPCELLREGDYFVRLQGASSGSAPVSLGRYSFRVLRQ